MCTSNDVTYVGLRLGIYSNDDGPYVLLFVYPFHDGRLVFLKVAPLFLIYFVVLDGYTIKYRTG